MVLGIASMLIGGALFPLLVRSLFRSTLPQFRAARGRVTAEGVVTGMKVQQITSGGPYSSRKVDVRFAHLHFTTADGRQVRYLQHLEMGQACRKGDILTVHYDPLNPENSATTESPYDVTTALMVKTGAALFFALFFVGGLLFALGVLHDTSSVSSNGYP